MEKGKKIIKSSVIVSTFLITAAVLFHVPAFFKYTKKSKAKINGITIERSENIINVTKKQKDNDIIFSCGVNGKNEPGFIPANEGEEVTADTFYVSDDYVFVDDTTGARILVYKNGDYNKTLKLEWNQNVVRMYYSPKTDMLSMVYIDLSKTDTSYYYFLKMKVSTEQIVESKQLSNKKQVLLDYYFDVNGNLQTEYLKEKSIEEDDLEEELNDILDDDFQYEECYSDKNSKTTICSEYDEDSDEVNECIVNSLGNTPETYAVPEAHNYGLDADNIQVQNKKIYQMVVNQDGITIYQLNQKNIKNNTIKMYKRNRDVETVVNNNKFTLLNSYESNKINKIIATSTNVSPLSYATIRKRIKDRYSIKWTYAPKNRNIKVVSEAKRKYVSAPGWLIAQHPDPTSSYSVENIPYCWGGYTNSFKTQIEQGYYAGNVNTNASSYIAKTAGLDCSGFVSTVYKLPKHFGTYELASSKYFNKRSSTSKVKQYDLLLNPGNHVVIVTGVYTQDSHKYVNTVEESCTYGKIVKREGRKYQSLINDGYYPYKYANIQN